MKEKIIAEIKSFFQKQGKEQAVIGLSGGIDSAVVLALLCEALSPQRVTAILMPNTKTTKKTSTSDAENLAKKLNCNYFLMPIDNIINSFSELPWEQKSISKANTCARIRANLLYNYANSFDSLVVGTGNKTEYYLGYFTKFGDGAADFFPIINLLKTEVRELAKELGLPSCFLEKAPSAELWENQEDEKELGLTYETIDSLLPLILEGKETPASQKDAVEKIKELIKKSEHKRK